VGWQVLRQPARSRPKAMALVIETQPTRQGAAQARA